MLEPAAAFFINVVIGKPRSVGFPLSSQSAMYSVRPMGRPATSEGRRPSTSGSEEVESGEGKIVEILARGVRFNIRRAITAAWYAVGISWLLLEEGLDQVSCMEEGLSRLLAARGRMAGKRILKSEIENNFRMLGS